MRTSLTTSVDGQLKEQATAILRRRGDKLSFYLDELFKKIVADEKAEAIAQ